MSENKIPGGYTSFRPATPQEQTILYSATQKGKTGLVFNPIAVSTAVINGISYRFLCDVSIGSPSAQENLYMVYVNYLFDGTIVHDKTVTYSEVK